MKTLQSNFTTLEQSKRLLELGVPEWTADLRYRICKANDSILGNPYLTKGKKYTGAHFNSSLPCWSVGRLIEIYLICNEIIDNVTELHHSAIKVDVREFNIVEYMIRKLSNKVKKNKSFFSKLEE